MRSRHVMEFERPLVALEDKLAELRRLDVSDRPELASEIQLLATEIELLHEQTYTNLSAWEKVQVSRHPHRPKTQDYLAAIFTDAIELHGDRLYGDDGAILAALATIAGRRVAVLGHRKGTNTRENIARNFGMAHPEGFRKAMRVMRLAEKFGLPLVTFIDTPGAYPGIEAEERGQAWAIAESLALLSGLGVPVVAVGIGEGGSGGALAIGFGDRLIMLENSYYSVISPEACAAILHKDSAMASGVAGCLALTAPDLIDLGIVDEVLPEPLGGAHRAPDEVFAAVKERVTAALGELDGIDPDALTAQRYSRLRSIGVIDMGLG